MAIIRDAAIHAALQCKGPLPPFVLDGHHLIPLYAKPTERNLFSGNTCITDSLAFCDDPLPSETSTTHITTLLYLAAFDQGNNPQEDHPTLVELQECQITPLARKSVTRSLLLKIPLL